MKTKTFISKKEKRKTNSELVETIRIAKKNPSWIIVSGILSSPRKNLPCFNLNELDILLDEKSTNIIPGKILSQGELTKKCNIIAWKFSEKAKEKILGSGSNIGYISEEIKRNPDCKDIKIIK